MGGVRSLVVGISGEVMAQCHASLGRKCDKAGLFCDITVTLDRIIRVGVESSSHSGSLRWTGLRVLLGSCPALRACRNGIGVCKSVFSEGVSGLVLGG